MDNFVKQNQEIEAMAAIYGRDMKTESREGRIYSVSLNEGGRQVVLFIHLPEDYPQLSPPSVEMSAPSLSRDQKAAIDVALNAVYLDNIGGNVLYQWVERVREFLQELPHPAFKGPANSCGKGGKRSHGTSPASPSLISIIHGEPIVDRKSCFQAHVAKIAKPSDVEAFLLTLKSERKVASAKHNVVAWRCGPNFGHDEDGEKLAGGKLLRLLELAKADNVVVAVSRWYGGIQLGADRFRHYGDSARQALVKAGAIKK